MIHAEVVTAIKQICAEKGISIESVVATLEAALAAAYRKDFGNKLQNIKVTFDMDKGTFKVFDVKTVMEKPEELEIPEGAELEKETEEAETKGGARSRMAEPEVEVYVENENGEKEIKYNPKLHISPEEAVLLKKDAKIGDEIKTPLEVPADFGRMAAQTAKQVIIQKIREAERNAIFSEYKSKEHTLIVGVVQRREGRNILIDFGKTSAILPYEQQIENERYSPNTKMKFYVLSVGETPKGAEIIVSRTHQNMLKELFKLEIPEVAAGTVEVVSVAREAGSRSKIAVKSNEPNIDPIGSCVGQRGARAQTIIQEVGGEKIDIIEYSEDPVKFISNSLSPAKVISIQTNEKEKLATVKVKEDQLSLAIGRGGQNVRLAAKLTGWKIDIIAGDEKDAEEETKEETGEKKVKKAKSSSAKATDDKEEKESKEEVAKEKKTKKVKKEKTEKAESTDEKETKKE